MKHITVAVHDHLLLQRLRILHNHCIGLRLLLYGAVFDYVGVGDQFSSLNRVVQ